MTLIFTFEADSSIGISVKFDRAQSMPLTTSIYNTVNFKEKLVLLFAAMLFVAQPIPIFSSKLAMFILAAIGIWILLFHRRIKQSAGFWQILTVFILLGLPGLISLFGSYNIERSIEFVLLIPLFFAAGIALYSLLQNFRAAQILSTVIAITSMCWVLDGIVQYILGADLLGVPIEDNGNGRLRITGPFRDNNHLGMLLAVTLPVTLKWLDKFHKSSQFVYIFCLAFVLLGTGARTHWVTFFFAIAGFYWFSKGGRLLLICTIVPALVLSVWVASSSSLVAQKKLNKFSSIPTTLADLDKNLSGRIHIWSTAINMGLTYPLTGVGVKSFKYAYEDSNLEWDPTGRKKRNRKVSHAHHQWISMFAETGIFGVISLVAIVLLILYISKRSYSGLNFYSYPWLLSFLLIINPLNSMQPLFKMWWFPIVLLVTVAQISAVEHVKNRVGCGGSN